MDSFGSVSYWTYDSERARSREAELDPSTGFRRRMSFYIKASSVETQELYVQPNLLGLAEKIGGMYTSVAFVVTTFLIIVFSIRSSSCEGKVQQDGRVTS